MRTLLGGRQVSRLVAAAVATVALASCTAAPPLPAGAPVTAAPVPARSSGTSMAPPSSAPTRTVQAPTRTSPTATPHRAVTQDAPTQSATTQDAPTQSATTGDAPTPASSTRTHPPGQFTFSFAGDVNFADRTLTRLTRDPTTAFGVAEEQLGQADLTMVNLETAITDRGEQQDKSFTFRAPASAFTALHDAGIDIATMANNHAADYGRTGLQDSLAAIAASDVHVVGIGADAAQAYAPYLTTVNGTKIAVFAATQVQDETLQNWTAGDGKPGVASAWSDRLISAVQQAKAAGKVVVTYLHWGTEYTTCPNADQVRLAGQLAAAGASAVVGTHAHVLQGAGWRRDGVYVAYGMSNYLWWRSFGNEQDDNGLLTLTFTGSRVTAADFVPSHLDDTGVPVRATGLLADRINAEWERDRGCADLSAAPPP